MSMASKVAARWEREDHALVVRLAQGGRASMQAHITFMRLVEDGVLPTASDLTDIDEALAEAQEILADVNRMVRAKTASGKVGSFHVEYVSNRTLRLMVSQGGRTSYFEAQVGPLAANELSDQARDEGFRIRVEDIEEEIESK